MATPKVRQVIEIRPELQTKLKSYAALQNKTIRTVVEEWLERLPNVGLVEANPENQRKFFEQNKS